MASPPYREYEHRGSGVRASRTSARLAGTTLPAINILTGDTQETRQVEHEGELIFEPTPSDSQSVDAMQVDVSLPGGKKQRMRWKNALVAFAATITPIRIPLGTDERFVFWG